MKKVMCEEKDQEKTKNHSKFSSKISDDEKDTDIQRNITILQ
jgi:hypothetical protein